jgi:hypothetical protein
MMRRRSAQYWLWTNSRLPMHLHEEVLDNGLQVEVQARVGHNGVTQVFVGIYSQEGRGISEEFHDRGKGVCCNVSLKWGTLRAHEIVLDHVAFAAPHRIQTTLGTVITDPTVLALRRMEMSEYERLKLKAADALSEYLEAKLAMLELMRQTRVDPERWSESKTRLRQAIDRRACIQRAYLR